jgi:hypothetical protein
MTMVVMIQWCKAAVLRCGAASNHVRNCIGVLQTLKAARQLGDFLLVGIHTDLTIRCVSSLFFSPKTSVPSVLEILRNFCCTNFDLSRKEVLGG